MEYKLKLHLNRVNGEVEIPFRTLSDLEAALKAIDWEKLLDTVVSDSVIIFAATNETPRPELEGVCTFGAGGLPRFSKIPKSDGEYVGLVLYSTDPRHLTPREIENLAGFARVTSNFLSHSHWKKYFQRDSEGKYHLSPEGMRWVTVSVLPKLKA